MSAHGTTRKSNGLRGPPPVSGGNSSLHGTWGQYEDPREYCTIHQNRGRTEVFLGSATKGTGKMKLRFIGAAFAMSLLPMTANAQLTIDMGAIKCDQYLAMSPAVSRDFSAWASGWFSYQNRRTFVDVVAHQQNIANLKAWCQYHPQEGVMAGMKAALEKAIGPQ
jgi:hypothetical protein